MKKFLCVLILVAIITTVYIKVAHTRYSVIRDDLIHNVLTAVVTPSQKFWVHRCNSVEKAAAMSEKFSGIEIDATFYSNETVGHKFDVSHDPKPSVQFPLENFMPVFAANDVKIWFDFKNLSADNSDDALSELETLLNKYNVDRTRFIIESQNFRELKKFHDAGFYTSFYVTISNQIFNDDEYRQEFIKKLREVEKSDCTDAISFPADYYAVMKSFNTDLDYLTWNVNGERWWTFYKNSSEIFDDPQIKVILIEFATKFDRF